MPAPETTGTAPARSHSLWTEKYRPASLDTLEGAAPLKAFLRGLSRGDSATPAGSAAPRLPAHLLLYGPPGTGKTSIAHLLRPTLVLNASDDRGIETIRTRVKQAAAAAARQVILLDECENLTRDAQTCLRRVLEDYHSTTFIFCTNFISRIIAPLQSRLLKLRVTLGTAPSLARIARAEGLPVSDGYLRALFSACRGDLRKAISVLQGVAPLLLETPCTAVQGTANACAGNACTADVLDATTAMFIGRVPDSLIEAFWNTPRDPRVLHDFARDTAEAGFGALQLIEGLSDALVASPAFSGAVKAWFSEVLAKYEAHAMGGAGDEMVISGLCLEWLQGHA